MARGMAGRVLLALAVLLVALSASEAGQNLRKTTCPICNMDVKQDINATILGDQLVFACEMAGHIDALQNDPVCVALLHAKKPRSSGANDSKWYE